MRLLRRSMVLVLVCIGSFYLTVGGTMALSEAIDRGVQAECESRDPNPPEGHSVIGEWSWWPPGVACSTQSSILEYRVEQ